MLTVIILTLIQSSFSLQDDPLPKTQLQLTEYGEYVTFIDEELHIPIISTGSIEFNIFDRGLCWATGLWKIVHRGKFFNC